MWNVVLLDDVHHWFMDLVESEDESVEAVVAAIDMLEEVGPTLGRPLVDRLKGSSLHRLKELRPSGTNIRILFAFDPRTDAVLLIAGDKTGVWNEWYRKNIPLAEQRYDHWIAEAHGQED